MDKKIPVGLSMYSIKEEILTDLEGTLAAIKSFGYDGFEFQGKPIKDPKYISKVLQDNGLDCVSWHFPAYQMFLGNDETFKRTADYLAELGIHYAIITVLPSEWYASVKNLEEGAAMLTRYQERLKPYDIVLGAHNHWQEFNLDIPSGKTYWTLLRELTPPDFVMEFDPGNAARGNADLIGELQMAADAGRAKLLHVKPYSLINRFETILGNADDICDYKEMCQISKKAGTEYIFIEYQNKSMFFNNLDGVRVTVERFKRRYGQYL